MKRTVSSIQRLLIPAVFLALAAPTYAQSLQVNPVSLFFPHVSTQFNPQTVTVTASNSALVNYSTTITYTSAPGGLPATPLQWLTAPNGTTGTPISVSVNTAPNGVSLVNGNYTADVTFSAGGLASKTLPVTLQVTGSSGGGTTTTLVSPTSLNLSSSIPNGTININAAAGTSYSISISYFNGSGWLSVPSFGTTTSTSTPVSVNALTSFLAQGTYSATLNVTVGSQFATVSVILTVGGGGTTGGISLSTTALNYALSQATTNNATEVQNFPTAFSVTSQTSQNVDIRSSTTVNTSGGVPWLSTTPANGVVLTANVPLGVNVAVDPRGLAGGSYSGTISIYQAGTFNLLASVVVTLTIGSNISPQSISVNVAAGSSLAEFRSITITGNSSFTISTTIDTVGSGSWLIVPVSSGTVTATQPFTLNATINPTGLGIGTYTGRITITLAGQQAQVIPVTLVVGSGSGTGGVVSPNPITLNAALGGTAFGTLTLSPGFASQYSITTSGVSWLSVSPTFGQTNPSAVVNLTGNGAIVSSGTYNTTLTVSFPGTNLAPVSVSVIFNVGTGGTSGAVSPSSLNFTSAVNGGSQSQSLSLNTAANTFYSASATTNTGFNWLSVSPTGGITSGTFQSLTVTVNPFGLAQGTYSGQISITAGGLQQSVPVTLVVGSGGSTGGLVSPSSLNFSSILGGSTQSQFLNLSANAGTFYNITTSTTTGQSWISVTPSNGVTSSSLTAITVNVNAFGLAAGTYSGQINVTAAGLNQTIPVTLTVGTSGGGGTGLISPSSLTFTSATDGGTQSQSLIITSSPGTFFQANTTTTTGQNWLFASPNNGVTSSSQHPLNITISPSGLLAGTYSGQVIVTVGGSTQTIPVTLVVGSGGGTGGLVSPTTLTFSSAVGGGTQVQTLNLSTTIGTFYTATATTSTGSSWLVVTPNNGVTGSSVTSLTVNVNPSFLVAGTYSGQIAVVAGSLSQTIPITLIVGGSGGTTGLVSPTSLTFTSVQGGGTQSQSLILNSAVGAFYSATATTTTGSNWLFVSPSSGTASGTQTSLTVTVNPFGLANGSYTGQINVVAGGQTQSIPITLNVGTGGSGAVQPSSLTFNAPINGSAPSQSLSLSTIAGTFYSVNSTINSGGVNWLLVSPNNGSASSNLVTLTVSVLPAGLAAGTYTGQISVVAGSVNQTIPVTLVVGGTGGTFAASPSALSFQAQGASTPSQVVQITSASGSVNFTATPSVTTSQSWLVVTPTVGQAPGQITVSVNPSGLNTGTYQGSINIAVAFVQVLQIPVTLTVSQSTQMTIRRVQNAASYSEQGVTPGMIVLLDVENLGGPSAIANLQLTAQNTVSTTLANTRVLFDGIAAPLVYVFNNFVSAIVPYEVGSRSSTSIVVEARGIRSAEFPARVLDAAPGVFTTNASGSGQGSISNADGSANSATNPALRRNGQFAVIYFTGEGSLNPSAITGGLAPVSPLRATVNDVQIRVGGRPAQKIFSGAVPTLIYGLGHASFFIPDDAPTGSAVPVEVIIGGRTSQANVTMAIAP